MVLDEQPSRRGGGVGVRVFLQLVQAEVAVAHALGERGRVGVGVGHTSA
ncbi:hypothetical protein ACFQFH_00370 [Halobaculum halobium]|uniref:Uncharacterized protein n=1 Tax=Halobaculum halobium TaxID=3032281 RepID=A0ABD5TKB5_9EURY